MRIPAQASSTAGAPSTEAGGERSYDAAKKIDGRKRHSVVDTVGNLLEVGAHAAGIQDYHGAKGVLLKLAETVTSLQKIGPMASTRTLAW